MGYLVGPLIAVISIAVFMIDTQYLDKKNVQIPTSPSLIFSHTVKVSSTSFLVSIAMTDQQRSQGLSGISFLPERSGKLFIFDKDNKHGIWMKDMLIPLDILWFGQTGELVYLQTQVSPDTYPTIYEPSEDTKYVLELNAGSVESLDIAVGDILVLPADLDYLQH
ncbi:MAG: uncharacterized membrane protein (UPF0127 family) [Acidimicrobiales bacterium]|jgi:uncharacterized membrane protein (UPF0127 family)